MAFLLQGNELIATSALSAKVLRQLASMAARRPLRINGVELRAGDLERLAEEARRTAQPLWIGTPPASHRFKSSEQRHDISHLIDPDHDSAHTTPPSAALASTAENSENGLPAAEAHRRKVLRHAAQKLGDLSHHVEPSEMSKRLRAFLKVEEERLRIAHRMRASGQQIARARSFVLDVLVGRLFQTAAHNSVTNEARGVTPSAHLCAVIALGGYGRGELAPFSDLDLLFLHTGRRAGAADMREMIERLLHLLWDAGLTIGHKTHTVNECLSAARADSHFETALVSARLVVGDEAVFNDLNAALERKRRKNPGSLLAIAQQTCHERDKKQRAAVYLQEPNVKESAGALRDLHAALWAAYARYGCRTLDELRAAGHISEDERLRAAQSYDFLLRVRHEAHWITNRKTDRLALDLQPLLAAKLGYQSSLHLQASEQFMRDYYRRAQDLHLFSESLRARAGAAPAARETQISARLFGRSTLRRRERLAELFSIKDRELVLEGRARLLTDNRSLFFEAVALAQNADAGFNHHLRDAVRQNLTAIDRDFRHSPKAANDFLEILRRRGRVGAALRLMHEVGLLGRYLPEFGRISLLIQHDLYHHYTIDEHTLRAIDALDELSNGDSHTDRWRAPLRAAFDEVEDVALLYFAVLLHDLGKGRGSGHVARGAVLAERICERLQLDERSAAKVVLLVKHHILMTHLSQRRDLSEPRLAADFAREVESLDVLNMLVLLTYADMNGVGPGVWSDWKGALLLELYHRARKHFDGGSTSPSSVRDDLIATRATGLDVDHFKQQVVDSLGVVTPMVTQREIEDHLTLLPLERYARSTIPEVAAIHLQLIARLKTNEPLACQWHPHASGPTALSIAVRDRRGLFADLAGSLAAQGIEILSANLNTRADRIAIDDFVLREAATRQAVAEHRLPGIERALCAAVTGDADVAALVERWRTRNAPRRQRFLAARHDQIHRRSPPHVIFDNEAAENTTVIEVRAADQPGLAYKIASLLAACGIDIAFARIATEKNDAFDVFYVTNAAGMKLSEAEMRQLEAALTTRLTDGERDGVK